MEGKAAIDRQTAGAAPAAMMTPYIYHNNDDMTVF